MDRPRMPLNDPMPVTSKIGDVIRKRREQMRLTQGELAERAGLSLPAVQCIETHQRYPTMNTVERICVALQVPLAVVVTEASFEA